MSVIQKVKFIDRRAHLKIKLKSLAAEARIIRHEEKKQLFLRGELRDHRIGIVRSEARHTLIAYGFIRGRTRTQLEGTSQKPVDWQKVTAMVKKYAMVFGPPYTECQAENAKILARFQNWKW